MIDESLMELLGSTIVWNKKHYKILSISIEPEGIQVWCDDHVWYYLRDGEWKTYSELDDEEEE